MGKKYIIELEDKPFHKGNGDFLYRVKGFNSLVFDMTGINKLTPYTEPNFERVRKEAYEKGFDDGRSKCSSREYCMNESYQQGLNDAWEAARKIIRMPEGDLLELFDVYSSVCTPVQVMLKYDASEAIEKIRQYEQRQEEIKVGDEVGYYYGVADEHGNVNYSGVVLEIREDGYLVMEKGGKTYALKENIVMSKTGRHFPEIAAVLEKMREGQK